MGSRGKLMWWPVLLVAPLFLLVLSGCASGGSTAGSKPAGEATVTVVGLERTAGGGAGGDIFRTGMDGAGPIKFTGGNNQAVSACVQCHGATGKGWNGPDITWKALMSAGFTQATVQRAITQGQDEAGKPLDDMMPRYSMSQADMNSLIAFLKTLR